MDPYREITRDAKSVTMRVFGSTPNELVEHAAEAMFSIGRDLPAIPPTYSRPLVAPGDNIVELVTFWLRELLALGIEEGIAWSQATVDRLEVGGVQGSAAGQYRRDVPPSGPVAIGVVSVGSIVEVPEGHWLDVTLEIEAGLRAV